jgi:DNA-binding CsgD family transcriptional regulator
LSTEGFAERASRLTPREWRVIAMVLEGVSTNDACQALGIAPGTLESHKQAIRRKLAIPRGERLERALKEFASSVPVAIPEEEAPKTKTPVPKEVQERRVRLLFRMTIEELLEVANNADLRASLLDQTVRRMSPEGIADASLEIEDLKKAAMAIRTVADELLTRARRRTAQASS